MTSALFGRSTPRRKFPVRVLSTERVDESLDRETQAQMKEIYKVYKQRLGLGGAAWYMLLTGDLAQKMWKKFEVLRERGTEETLRWSAKKTFF